MFETAMQYLKEFGGDGVRFYKSYMHSTTEIGDCFLMSLTDQDYDRLPKQLKDDLRFGYDKAVENAIEFLLYNEVA